MNSLPDFDIAVVGGGASGVYAAWRMLLEGPQYSEKLKKWAKERGKLRIALFEESERIGGRLLSAKAPGLPDVVLEIGGMRYVSSQTLVKSLVENKFNLPRHKMAVTEKNNIAFLRNKQLRISDLSDADKLPYNLAPDEIEWLKKEGNSADNFLGFAVIKIFPDILKYNGQALRNYLNQQVIQGKPLYEHGFWNLIASSLSHEAYQVAVTTVGYDCLGFNTNAVDAICEYFDFTPDVQYYLLDQGYESLLWIMQKEFQESGGEVMTQFKLKSFDEAHLEDGSKGVSLIFEGEKKVHTCRELILAMPKKSLELLAQRGPVLDPERAPRMRYLMNSVEGICLYKMLIAYSSPWWEAKGVIRGRSLTDIPIRQCYYWGGENKDQSEGKLNTNSIIMVYNDALSSTFWGGLRYIPLGPDDEKVDAQSSFKRSAVPGGEVASDASNYDKRLYKNWEMAEAPKAMVEEMHRELKVLHGIPDAPEPFEAAYIDWGDNPYGGAVHFWNPGYKSTEIMNEIIQPIPSFPCYICGEAYSNGQTWVEGAFQTAELVLRKFDIPMPKWVK